MVDDPESGGLEAQLVVFRLGEDFFAIPIANVNQVIPLQKITPVPRAPAFVEGVTDLATHGRVIPVVDLRKRFGLQPKDEGRARIIVSEQGTKLIGLTVDGVDEVLTVPASSIEEPDDLVVSVDSQFLAGIVRLEDRLIILLDQEQVLSANESRQLDRLRVGGQLLDQARPQDEPASLPSGSAA